MKRYGQEVEGYSFVDSSFYGIDNEVNFVTVRFGQVCCSHLDNSSEKQSHKDEQGNDKVCQVASDLDQ